MNEGDEDPLSPEDHVGLHVEDEGLVQRPDQLFQFQLHGFLR